MIGRPKPERTLLLSAIFAVLVACGGAAPIVEDRLDPLTGVTVTRSSAPLILYRDNSASAAHARDFVYLGPLLVNRMGEHSYYLWLGIWSTHSARDVSAQRDGFDAVIIYADGEPLQLEIQGWTPDSIGVSEPVYTKPVASAADAYYRVTHDQVRLIAEASDVRLQTVSPRPGNYALWDNQSVAQSGLRAFLEHDAL